MEDMHDVNLNIHCSSPRLTGFCIGEWGMFITMITAFWKKWRNWTLDPCVSVIMSIRLGCENWQQITWDYEILLQVELAIHISSIFSHVCLLKVWSSVNTSELIDAVGNGWENFLCCSWPVKVFCFGDLMVCLSVSYANVGNWEFIKTRPTFGNSPVTRTTELVRIA